MPVNLTINGKNIVADDLDKSLLHFLREDLGLVGAKDGCSRGQCGTCTVIINGKAIRSCLRKMKSLDGAVVETIEGLANRDVLHPLQIAFLKSHAYQCGFCTPGVILAAKALLDENPHPTDDEIKHALRFNYCRCTGYTQIIDAVRMAVDIIDGKDPGDLFASKGWVGESPVTKNGIERVTGQALFTDDFPLKNALQGRIVFPEYPHAKILSIDTSEALKQPGVIFIATHKDIPGYKYFGQETYPQQILAIEKVRFIGDPVAVVYAETTEQADVAKKFIKVEYEVLPVIKTAEQGYVEDSVRVHEEYPNGFFTKKNMKGNVERGFAQSDIILEQDTRTQTVEHGCLEPEGALAEIDEKGRVVVYGGVQNPSACRKDIAHALGFPLERVRTITRACGGSFGKREDQFCHIFVALGAYHTKRPVRVILTRNEVFNFTTKRHAINFHYKVGATKGGKLLAVQAKTITDTGAYSGIGDFLATCCASMGTGPYEVPNVDIEATAVFTNKVVAQCFRGYGSTQVAVVTETLVDRVAEACGISPFEVRRINGLDIGKQTTAGQIIEYSCGFQQLINEVETALKKDGIPDPSAAGKKIGVGVSGGFKNMGYGNGLEDSAGAKIQLTHEGRLQLLTGGVELGQGHDTVVCQIAAEAMNVHYNDIDIALVDDDITPKTMGSTSASRMTYISGNATLAACALFKEKLFNYVGEKAGFSPGVLDCDSNGVYDCRKEGSFRMSFADIAKMLKENEDALDAYYYYTVGTCNVPLDKVDNIDHEMILHRFQIAYCFALQTVIVEVDEETGKVKVLRVYAANDCGRAINPALVEGQIIGSVVMGMGYCLSEKFVVEDGYNLTKEYKDLKVPSIIDTPEIIPIFVEETHPFGPFGAKGFGEMALNPTAPAILNAIYNACGVRVNSLPVDSEKLAAAIKGDKIYR